MLDWHNISTVFLDMDGTLLDLNFDNHFWQEHVPLRFAQTYNLELEAAKDQLYPRFRKVEGTMDWYCIDYWSQELGLDIAELKREVDHLINVHPHVIEFLDRVRGNGIQLSLVTNAHAKSLELKMDKTRLAGHFDSIICAHDFGIPKEHQEFWGRLRNKQTFDPLQTLLVDDSLPVLRSAREYGVAHLLAVHKPDSQSAQKDVGEFRAIHSFDDIMPTSFAT